MARPTRILLVDDHRLVREGLRALLNPHDDLDVVAEASDGREAVTYVRELSPDVAVMDVAMPGLNGVEATRQIANGHPETRVLALSMHSDQRFIAQMLEAGAVGYLLKDCAFDEIAQAIRVVASGHIYLSPTLTDALIRDYVSMLSSEQTRYGTALTPGEREVLQLLAEGKTTKQVAARLGIGAKTIETHRSRLMDKLGINSVAGLTKYAIREGITSVDA